MTICRFPWPYHEGVDFSRLGNWREWLGFFEYPQAGADFIGVYDTAANEGVARVFPADVARGAKGFGRVGSGFYHRVDSTRARAGHVAQDGDMDWYANAFRYRHVAH